MPPGPPAPGGGPTNIPVFSVGEAGLDAAGLLFVGDVQEELEDDHAVVGERALKLVDVFKAGAGYLA